jgi:peptidoglycan/LPS O-acetylase OafA/YrhL
MDAHKNNIGILRLIFAAMVIVSHSSELIYGNRNQEIFTILFHTISAGGFAVQMFFLLSGYLVTLSAETSASFGEFIKRRALRIFPGYFVCVLICAFVIGPFLGTHPLGHIPQILGRALVLGGVARFPGELEHMAYPGLNGSLWTIPHEFRCYLLIGLLQFSGVLKNRKIVFCIAGALLTAMLLSTLIPVANFLDKLGHNKILSSLIGELRPAITFLGTFMCGVLACIYRERLTAFLTTRNAALCAVLTVCLMFFHTTAELGLATVGGLTLFWLAFKANLGPFQRVNNRWDISYGAYLYGWPIQTALIYFLPKISPVALSLLAIPLACLAGAASWILIESRTKDLGKRERREAAAV